MKNIKRNIVYVGYDSYYKDTLKLRDTKINNIKPNLINIDTLEELDRKQGFLLLLTMDELYDYFPNIVDIFEPDVYEIDRYLRKKFKNFEYVIVISIEEFDYGHIPFSNMYVVFANNYFNTDEGINVLIDKISKEFISKKESKLSKIKCNNVEKLRTFIKKSKKDFFTTEEIKQKLNVNEKWIQRYMKEMNNIYNNIGYNKRKRLWYVVKKTTRKNK